MIVTLNEKLLNEYFISRGGTPKSAKFPHSSPCIQKQDNVLHHFYEVSSLDQAKEKAKHSAAIMHAYISYDFSSKSKLTSSSCRYELLLRDPLPVSVMSSQSLPP